MSRSHTLALNTAATYLRSLVSLGLTLFSSRWVLQALGTDDFGTYSVIASLTVFVTFLNGVLANSVARHLAFAIGTNRPGEVRAWFNTALSLHLTAAITLVAVGWPMGHWFITNHLSVDPARLATANRIFEFGLIGAFVTMVTIPYSAMFTAKQRLTELALIGVFQSCLVFGLALALKHTTGDLLRNYAFGMAGIVVGAQSTIIIRATSHYTECRPTFRQWFGSEKTREVLHFAGWNLFGWVGGTLRDSGSALLVNLQFGPQVNAAYGIALQIAQGTNQLAAALMGAFTPEMTTSEGRGERERMLQLAQRMNKYGTLIVLLFALPLMLQMDFVLTLWLKTPPAHAATFSRLVLLVFLIDRLTTGYMLAVSAHGKIAAYQATLGSFLILTLPIAWVILHIGAPPQAVYWASLVTILLCSGGRVLWARKLFKVGVRTWFGATFLPCLKVSTAASLVGFASIYLPLTGFAQFAVTVAATVLSGTLGAWTSALSMEERSALRRLFAASLNKLPFRTASAT